MTPLHLEERREGRRERGKRGRRSGGVAVTLQCTDSIIHVVLGNLERLPPPPPPPPVRSWCVLPVTLQWTSSQRRSTEQDSRSSVSVPSLERLSTLLSPSWHFTTKSEHTPGKLVFLLQIPSLVPRPLPEFIL